MADKWIGHPDKYKFQATCPADKSSESLMSYSDYNYRILLNKHACLNKHAPDFWAWLAISQELFNRSIKSCFHQLKLRYSAECVLNAGQPVKYRYNFRRTGKYRKVTSPLDRWLFYQTVHWKFQALQLPWQQMHPRHAILVMSGISQVIFIICSNPWQENYTE